jgi:nitrogen fixation/metabolism regulation signal transduction histidine kinase
MTRELELAGARAHKSARETEQQRAWLEAVLERLSAGVLGFDREARLRSANRAAESILGVALTKHLGASAAEIGKAHANLAAFAEPLARHCATTRASGARKSCSMRRRCAHAHGARRGAPRSRRLRRSVRRSHRAQSRAARRGGARSRGASRTRSRIR